MNWHGTLKWTRRIGAPVSALLGSLAATAVLDSKPLAIGTALITMLLAYAGEIGDWLEAPARRYRVADAVLQYLMHHAFDADSDHDKGRPKYRATILWAGAWPWKRKRIQPILRASLGGHVAPAESDVFFGPKDQFAGVAWSCPGTWIVHDDLKSIEDCEGRQDRWEGVWIDNKVPRSVVEKMGDYMKHVRGVACLGVRIDGLRFVVSIDTTLENGFGGDRFKRLTRSELANIIESFARQVR